MENGTIPKVRVYLVEDFPLLRESLTAMLELEPEIEVVGEAAEAELALQTLQTVPADVVLMDVRLPGMNGIEATRVLKQNHPDMPVVVLTSYDDEYMEAAIEAGAAGYILKSCTRQQLVQALRGAVQGQMPIDPSLTGKLVREVVELRRTQVRSLLTPRQLEILKMVALGTRYREIASKLSFSLATVKREVRSIFNRLNADRAAQAVSEAHKRGLL